MVWVYGASQLPTGLRSGAGRVTGQQQGLTAQRRFERECSPGLIVPFTMVFEANPARDLVVCNSTWMHTATSTRRCRGGKLQVVMQVDMMCVCVSLKYAGQSFANTSLGNN